MDTASLSLAVLQITEGNSKTWGMEVGAMVLKQGKARDIEW